MVLARFSASAFEGSVPLLWLKLAEGQIKKAIVIVIATNECFID